MKKPAGRAEIMSGLFWKLMERGGGQSVQFVVQVILARLLLPEDYGTLAIVVVFTQLANVFVVGGLNSSLIQKKEADDLDYSSVFWAGLAVAGLFYVLLLIASPYVALFFRDPVLSPVLRVLALVLFLGAFRSVQTAIVSKSMEFKKLFYSSVGATVISGAAGISAAYLGYGVWALVIQQLTASFFLSGILWFMVKWRPARAFSWVRLKGLFSFGWRLMASSLLGVLYNDLRTLVIGRLFAVDILGYYNRGRQFPALMVQNLDGSIQAVMFPALSGYQHNVERMRSMMRRTIITSAFLIFPMMAGMAVIAEPMVIVVLTDTWLPSVPFLRIFCATYALQPIHGANLQAIKALGRSDVFLKLELIKRSLSVMILVFTIPYGVYAIVWGGLVAALIGSFINAYPNRSLLNYRYEEQLKDVLPSLLLSLLMAALVYAAGYLPLTTAGTLFVQISLGISIYFGLAYALKLESFRYLLHAIRTRGQDETVPAAGKEKEEDGQQEKEDR